MTYLTAEMGLTVWDQLNDPYDHQELEANWVAIDDHDHTPGKGVSPLPLDAIPEIDGTKIADDSLCGNHIGDDCIGKEHLEDCSVGPDELCDNAVTNPKVADNAIDTPELVDEAVTEAKIAPLNVTGSRLGEGSVTNTKLGDKAVISSKIANYAVTNTHLGTDTVDTRVLANDAVGAANIQDRNVTTSKIAAQAVGGNELGALPGVKLWIGSGATVSNDTLHPVVWDGSVWNNANMWSSGANVVIQFPGIYLIEGGVMFQDNGPGVAGGRRMTITKNGSVISGIGPITDTETQMRLSATTIDRLVPGDILQVVAYHTAGVNIQIVPHFGMTHFGVTYIGGS